MANAETRPYSPYFFLASLGNGGLAVAFFMYLMFMVKHPDTPVPTFNHLYPLVTGPDRLVAALVLAAIAGVLYFTYQHVRLLVWNTRQYMAFKRSDAYQALKRSPGEVVLMAIPLTYAMTISVSFIIGALFVPNLWSVVEYVFPLALAGYAAVGFVALRLFAAYASRILAEGGYNPATNNHLGQLIASFAFAMLAVGFAAPAAMSHTVPVSAAAIFLSLLFAGISVVLLIVQLVMGVGAMLQHGVARESSPSLWIIIPILTVLGITFVRLVSGVFHNLLHTSPPPTLMFVVLGAFLAAQVVIAALGYGVMKRIGYFEAYVYGPERSPISYALLCPGVAFFVLGMFFVHWGLVRTGIVPIFTPAYYALIVPLVLVKLQTIRTLVRLNGKLLARPAAADASHGVPAQGAARA